MNIALENRFSWNMHPLHKGPSINNFCYLVEEVYERKVPPIYNTKLYFPWISIVLQEFFVGECCKIPQFSINFLFSFDAPKTNWIWSTAPRVVPTKLNQILDWATKILWTSVWTVDIWCNGIFCWYFDLLLTGIQFNN